MSDAEKAFALIKKGWQIELTHPDGGFRGLRTVLVKGETLEALLTAIEEAEAS